MCGLSKCLFPREVLPQVHLTPSSFKSGFVPITSNSRVGGDVLFPATPTCQGWKCSHPPAWCLAGCPPWQMAAGPWWFMVPCAYDLITLRKAVCWILQPGCLPQHLGGKVTSSRLACATQCTLYTKASGPCFLCVSRTPQFPLMSVLGPAVVEGIGQGSLETHIGGAELRSETMTNRTQLS